MKNRLLNLMIGLFIINVSLSAQRSQAYFTSYPCISPDGKHVVFTYEGDLWKVSSDGGTATRLTAMQGEETRAKYSPDGKWIAFTGSQYGNDDVYILPADGGEVRQLTYHEAWDHVDNWSWDSKQIYFTSSRENTHSGYIVHIEGGTPMRLFHDYFHNVHNMAVHPDGQLFFSETMESKAQAHRKGYKGSYNPDIQSYNPKTKKYQKYTTYEGKDMWPTVDRTGNVYFVSDEKNGQYNLCVLSKNKTVHLTSFDRSIKHPVVSAEGRFVVFEKDFQIYKYDVQSKRSSLIPISVFTNKTSDKEQDFSVAGKISYFDASADGKKLAFVSRGELFVSDVKGKFIQKINTSNTGRVTEVKWKDNNKTLLFVQTNTDGFTNLFSIRADTVASQLQLTDVSQNDRDLTLNKDRTKAVYLSGRNDIKMIDLLNDSVSLIVQEEIWGFQNSAPSFSPNDEYVLFTAKKNFEEDIFIYHLENKKLINLTKTGITENSPTWSPDGRYIYFTSNRTQPAYPFGLREASVYRLPLEKYQGDFRSRNFDSLFIEKPKVNKSDTDSLTATSEKESYTIDLEKILDRVERVSPGYGSQGKSFVLQKGEKTIVIYSSDHGDNEYNLWMTTYEPFEKTKTEKIEGAKAFSAFVSRGGDIYYALVGGNIHTLNLDGKKLEKIDIAHTFRKNLKKEFDQMFHETWANVQENFYNETFHGLDWKKTKLHYGQFLEHVSNRAALRVLIADMLGDLNSSHTGFSSFGDEESIFYKTRTLGTGIVWEDDKPYTVNRIISYSPADKKGVDLVKGDILVSIDGQEIDNAVNREYCFARPSLDDEVAMRFKRGDSIFQVHIHPVSYGRINSLRYDEWIAMNQAIVDKSSNNRIAYAYMKDMGQSELENFLVDMASEAYDKDALILDIRYNSGGNVHDKVLQFLSQRPYVQWKYREGALTMQPNFTPAGKPIILLTNERSLSDAEMTAEGFKRLGLGKIIGMETYRWIIFTSGKGLVDGSFYRLPSWGCYTLDGKNLELIGVTPDIIVKMDFMDRLNKLDPQLDRAISEIMKVLR